MIQSKCTLRSLLREETQSVHEALHDLPVFRRLAGSVIGRTEYAALLQRMETFHAAQDAVLVAACRRHGRCTGNVVPTARAPLLAGDLAALGLDPACAQAPRLPRLESAAAIAGALYVIDGAMLGGATLGRAVRRLDWPAPGGYWTWCQTEGAATWRRTLALIDRVDRGANSHRAALAAASGTFAAFTASLGQLRAEPVR